MNRYWVRVTRTLIRDEVWAVEAANFGQAVNGYRGGKGQLVSTEGEDTQDEEITGVEGEEE